MSKKRKSRIGKWIITGIIAVGIIGIISAYIMRPIPSAYESAVAKTSDIKTYYSFSGNVESKNRQTVAAEKVMQVSSIKVKEGDRVNEGTVLLETTTGDTITSKISGEVANLNIEENAQVMTGIKLMEIVDYNHLEIAVKVDEYDISALEKGKEATVKIGALDKEFKGSISSMSKEGQVSNGVTFFTATIDLEQDESIKIGMSAEVSILSNTATGVVTLPMTAVQFDDNNKAYIYKKGERETYIRSEIATGINDGSSVEVKSGVTNGETVFYSKPAATANRGFPRPGMDRNQKAGGES